MEITYEQFLSVIQEASFIQFDDITVDNYSISEKPNVESVCFKGCQDNQEYGVDFDKADNDKIKVGESSAFPVDTEGEEIQVSFYSPLIITKCLFCRLLGDKK